MRVVTSARKRQTGNLINHRQSTSRQESVRLQVSLKTVKKYVYRVRNGIPIYEASGRPSVLDHDHFLDLVDYVGELPPENAAGNKLLIQKYRELTKETLIRRLLEVNDNVDAAQLKAPYSQRTRRRYCERAVAAFAERRRNCVVN